MSGRESYRRILATSTIMGGASAVNIAGAMLRAKAAAVLLGPAGVGLIGLLQSLMATASVIASSGLGTVGTRHVASAVGSGNDGRVTVARRALFWGTAVLSVLGGTVFYLFGTQIADTFLAGAGLTGAPAWIAVGVILTVAGGSQSALLSGMRRINDVAMAGMLASVFSTLLGCAILWLWGRDAILAFVLVVPMASFILGHVYVSRMPRLDVAGSSASEVFRESLSMVRFGAMFMLASAVVASGQLAVRTIVQRDLGADALGNFQASWAISMTYMGFILQSMGADYYPRLGAVVNDPAQVNRMVGEQTEVTLLLAGPVFLGLMGVAPWILGLLYTGEFTDAINVLRWQILGDLLKVASWPLGFALLAAGDGRAFLLSEACSTAIFIAATWAGLEYMGIEATGIAFVLMYLCYLPLVYILARNRLGVRWHKGISRELLGLCFIASAIYACALLSSLAGAFLGLLAGVVLALVNLGRLQQVARYEFAAILVGKANRVGRILKRSRP